jgi:N-acetylneuraminic acid mutarotase
MIVWGGGTNDGSRYNPGNNTWAGVAATGAPASRDQHTAVWTGSEMIVWGGWGSSGCVNDGGQYNPVSNTWTAVTTSSAPGARYRHTAVWTGSEMIVWGGRGSSDPLNDTWCYTPGRTMFLYAK